jgi:hypothetical protein
MKNLLKLIGIAAITAVIGFSLAACDNGTGGGGGGGPRTVTYSGTTSSGSYSLKIIEKANNPNRAALSDPLPGDGFEFTWTDSANKTKKSAGQVAAVSGNEFTMLPSNAATNQTTFTTTVSDEGLTAMNGTFTWTDGTTNTGSGTLTPSGGPGTTPGGGGGGGGGGGSGGKLTVQNFPAVSGSGFAFGVWNYSGRVTDAMGVYNMTSQPNGGLIAYCDHDYSTSPVQLYDYDSLSNNTNIVPFGRSGTFVVEISDGHDMRLYSQVKFTNGNATINWNSHSFSTGGF